jgi:ABC-type polysaccharide/polyol phosphate export permease
MQDSEKRINGVTTNDLPLPSYDSALRGNRIMEELRELWRYRDLVRNMVMRNITARYKRSFLGVIWTLLDPLLTMLVMAFVYSALFAHSIEDFPIFLFSGLIIWNFFSQSTLQAMTDLIYSGGLINRVYFPKSVYCIAAVGTGIVNFVFTFIVLLGIMVLYGRPFPSTVLFLPIPLLIATFFALGVGFFMSSFAVFFTDVVNLYRIGLRLLMFLSGIFYTLDFLPERMTDLIALIPTYHIVANFRIPIYSGTLPTAGSLIYTTIWAITAFSFGIWIYTKFSDQYGYRI